MKNESQVTEKRLKLTAREIRNLLVLDDFKVTRRTAYVYGKDKEDTITLIKMAGSFVVMFNHLMKQHGPLITEQSYVDYVMNMFYRKSIEGGIAINEKMRNYLLWRTEGAYRGFVAELYAVTLMLESVPNILIIKNQAADIEKGEDFSVICLSTKSLQSVHVTSIGGLDFMDEKEQRVKWRTFKGHVILTYNYQQNDRHSFLKNGFPFFYKKYLVQTFEECKKDERIGISVYSAEFESTFTNCGGEWEVFRSNDIDPSYEEEIQEIKRILGNKI
ncbi:MAG: hypothetical protein JJU16_01280 [Alkalibacterium sp.]|nr:hypothetical protein [Alkalibacterium sp.]